MRIKKFLYCLLISLFLSSLLLLQPLSATAYTNGQAAEIVWGQTSFTTNTAGTSDLTLNGTTSITVADGRLVVSENTNNRILIWNTVPMSNTTPADIVLGQQNFTSNTANYGGISASTLNNPQTVMYSAGKLFVADSSNSRILIWTTFPTRNGQPADLVLGQPNFTSNTANNGGRSASTFNSPWDVASDGTKLAVVDNNNNRILIWNSIPANNQQAADVLIGQPSFTALSSSGVTANTFRCEFSCNLDVVNGKLFLADKRNARFLVWNSIPTANNTNADQVFGQPTMTARANCLECGTYTVNSTTTRWPSGAYTDGQRLYLSDHHNYRIMVYNSIPTNNNPAADYVLGRATLDTVAGTSGGTYTGGISASETTGTNTPVYYNGYLLVANGNRILYFRNDVNNPSLSITESPESIEGGLVRLTGFATIPTGTGHRITNVVFSVNGGGFAGATAVDGAFDGTDEEFYLDFNTQDNQPTDSQGNLVDGYSVRVKSITSNADITDNLFYFSPFNLNLPVDNAIVSTIYPTFDFTVIKHKAAISDNLSKYMIQIKRGIDESENNTNPWETLIDNIPLDGSLDEAGNTMFENDQLKVIYTDESSRIKVTSKITGVTGSFEWKAVAVDKSGHTEDSNIFSMQINARITNPAGLHFPLAILNISGLGDPFISTSYVEGMKENYLVRTSTPTFFGIAFANSKIDLTLTEHNCALDCTRFYTTITNLDSRYGINIPAGDLKVGSKYTVNMAVRQGTDYNEIPSFTIQIIGR